MKVELFRMASEPMVIEVEGTEATIKQVLSAPGSGKVLGEPERTLLDVANERYNGVEGLGNLRVNGSAATLETEVHEGQTILIIPKVEGGVC
jgi:molybdopterin converting factor small subunit